MTAPALKWGAFLPTSTDIILIFNNYAAKIRLDFQMFI
jgi:hypothetical protein